jgi:CTP synthase (UTP-ammonia lyase)
MPLTKPARFALIGDYDPAKVAHQAIPRALELAAALRRPITWDWISTASVPPLESYAGVWLVPGSPYRSEAGALAAVRWARETGRPFLGTCAGFQHAMLEIARDVGGLRDAVHAETNPDSPAQVLIPLSCSLVEKSGRVHFAPGSQLAGIYGVENQIEGYHCNYGLNPAFRTLLEGAGLRFSAADDAGDVRAAELTGHRFFIGTLFQPERSALRGIMPPLVRAFVEATTA